MDLILLLKAAVLGIVEGLTEFLPISSTGHLILASTLLGFHDERGKLFEIVIQSGAILGLLFGKAIKAYLFNAPTVAATFILGGLVILWAEKRQHRVRVDEVEELTAFDALKLGLAQALALIPGTSRSGATIVGGLFFGLSRRAATEFSFFLAIPTILLASAYQLYKERHLLVIDDLGLWAVGFLTAFVSAFWAVRALLRYISTHDFTLFAWYRIAFGGLILITWHYQLIAWS